MDLDDNSSDANMSCQQAGSSDQTLNENVMHMSIINQLEGEHSRAYFPRTPESDKQDGFKRGKNIADGLEK